MILDYLIEIYNLIEETIVLSLSYFVNTNKRIHFVGDWTINELPNTLESAAMSGIKLVKKEF